MCFFTTSQTITYHSTIEEQAKEFEGEFHFLTKNTSKIQPGLFTVLFTDISIS